MSLRVEGLVSHYPLAVCREVLPSSNRLCLALEMALTMLDILLSDIESLVWPAAEVVGIYFAYGQR